MYSNAIDDRTYILFNILKSKITSILWNKLLFVVHGKRKYYLILRKENNPWYHSLIKTNFIKYHSPSSSFSTHTLHSIMFCIVIYRHPILYHSKIQNFSFEAHSYTLLKWRILTPEGNSSLNLRRITSRTKEWVSMENNFFFHFNNL